MSGFCTSSNSCLTRLSAVAHDFHAALVDAVGHAARRGELAELARLGGGKHLHKRGERADGLAVSVGDRREGARWRWTSRRQGRRRLDADQRADLRRTSSWLGLRRGLVRRRSGRGQCTDGNHERGTGKRAD